MPLKSLHDIALVGLNVNKSTGPDDISPYILKETAHQLSPLLTYLFNRSSIAGTKMIPFASYKAPQTPPRLPHPTKRRYRHF